MKPSEKYGQCTADGCKRVLNELHGLDETITIKELSDFLNSRMLKAKKEFETRRKKLIKELTGRCFKIRFGTNHIVLLKIDAVKVIDQYGSVEGILIGESLTEYNGEFRHNYLDEKSNKLYSNFFPNDKKVAFTERSFNIMKKTFLSLKFK